MKFIKNERAFTLIEMMIISNVESQKWRNRNVRGHFEAVAKNGKPQ